MSHFRSFLLGMGVAYGVYYITRKGTDGRSVLDELLDNPNGVMQTAKKYAIANAVETIKEHIK